MAATDFGSMDDFLGHNPGGGGGKRKFLKWKDGGSVRLWLHKHRLPIAVWQHQIPQIVEREDRETGAKTIHIWSKQMVCWESEEVLSKQRFRDKVTDEREYPPKVCPICKLLEAVRQKVSEQELNLFDEVFRFESEDSEDEARVIHAGTFCSMLGWNIDETTKKAARKAGVDLQESWMENGLATCKYIFCVVDDDDVSSGIQIATEAQSVGQRVQEVINDARNPRNLGPDKGNPTKHPYCIEVLYDKKQLPKDRYRARRLEGVKLTPEIEEIIDGEVPDLSSYLKPFDGDQLRIQLEAAAKIDLPWDDIFSAAQPGGSDDDFGGEPEEKETSTKSNPSRVKKAELPPPESEKVVEKPKGTNRKPKPKEEPKPEAKVKMLPCDECGTPMAEDCPKCPKCGAEYDIN